MMHFVSKLILVLALFLSSGAQSQGQIMTTRVKLTTSGAVTTSSVLLVPENRYRRGFSIWNNSGNSVYVSFGPTSSSATPTLIIPTYATFQMFTGVIWTGEISAIRNSGTGTLTVTEIW